ncbi:hypothetical protein V8E51_019792 [Hyaloscypha variabilis]
MSDRRPTTPNSWETCHISGSKLDGDTRQAIHSILGRGLGYDELAAVLQKMGRSYPRNTIIEEEFEYFKEEILNMKRERGVRHRPSKVFSNSLNSIVKRLQGESVPGVQVDREKRRGEYRLLSKDAQSNTLRGYITLWEKERNALRVGSPINSKQSRKSTACTSQNAPAAVGKSQNHHIVEPQFEPIPNEHYDTETALGAYSSLYNNHLQRPSSNTYTIPSAAQHQSPVEHIDPSVIALKDPDHFVHTGDAVTTLINWPPLSNYDQVSDPSPSEYIQEVEMPDTNSPDLTTFEISTAVERYTESQETGTQVSQWPEQLSYKTTVYDTHESDFMNYVRNMDEGSVLDIRTSPENTLRTTIEQPVSPPDVREVSTRPATSRPARKRRRHYKHGASTSSSEYGIFAAESFTRNVIHDEYGMTKGPASSETPLEAVLSGNESSTSQSEADNWALNSNRTTLLEEQLEKEKADHQKTKEELDRAMADILDLREQVEKLQVASKRTSQHYDGLARDLLQEKIVLKANLTHQRFTPQRLRSSLLYNSTEVEDLNHTRQSRNIGLRPLSIIQSTRASETLPAQSKSLTSSHNASLPRLRFPVATSSGSGSGSTVASSSTSTIRSSSPVPSGGVSGGLAPASHIGQSRPSSSSSHMTQNVNTTVKKGFQGFQGLRNKISNQFMRHDREEKINTIQPAPALESLPALSPSVPLQREMSSILIDGDKRHTGDSGYASIELERVSRTPTEDFR